MRIVDFAAENDVLEYGKLLFESPQASVVLQPAGFFMNGDQEHSQ